MMSVISALQDKARSQLLYSSSQTALERLDAMP